MQLAAKDPRYSGTQPFQTNGAPKSNTSVAPAPKTTSSGGGAPPAASLSVEEHSPDQSSPIATRAPT